jgi:5-methyltetrahydrofolate--homocysteine methyltransferase
MGRTIIEFEDMGLRDEYKFMTGGAPVTQEFADDMGADGYADNAITCVEKAKELITMIRLASAE